MPPVRPLITIGLLLAVASVVASPGLGAAVAVVAYIGWLREATLRSAALDRLRAAGLELEAAGKRADRLQETLEAAVIHRVEYRLAGAPEVTVH